MTTVYWKQVQLEQSALYIAAIDEGICYIGTPNAPFEEMEQWVNKRIKKGELVENTSVFDIYEQQLQQYLKGERKLFTFPFYLFGTAFQRQVWRTLVKIPYGQTYSYMDIAEKIGNPKAVRAVGGAIGANPLLFVVPCHRVVTKDGKLGGFRAGVDLKKQLLALESSLQ